MIHISQHHKPRITLGGTVYHVLNRVNGRLRIFRKEADFLAFEQILAEGLERFDMRLCGYCIMSNHWHLILWPCEDGDLSHFMRWVTLIHTQRYHASHGIGHLYQGRYKSFPVQDDAYYLTAMRYVEANPLRAKLVKDAAEWPWSSFAIRQGAETPFDLSNGPLLLPKHWPAGSRSAAHRSDRQVGQTNWIKRTAAKMNLQSTLTPRGRPKKCTGHEWH